MVVTINPESSVSELPVLGREIGNILNLRLRAQKPADCQAWDPITSQDRQCIDNGFRIVMREGKLEYRPKCCEAVISLNEDLHFIIIRDLEFGLPVDKTA